MGFGKQGWGPRSLLAWEGICHPFINPTWSHSPAKLSLHACQGLVCSLPVVPLLIFPNPFPMLLLTFLTNSLLAGQAWGNESIPPWMASSSLFCSAINMCFSLTYLCSSVSPSIKWGEGKHRRHTCPQTPFFENGIFSSNKIWHGTRNVGVDYIAAVLIWKQVWPHIKVPFAFPQKFIGH